MMSRKFYILTTAVFAVCMFFAFAGVSSAAGKEIVSTLKHKEAGLKCIDCHGTDKPTKMPRHSACIKCHDSGNGNYTGEMRTYINSGKEREFNMHDSHQGPVRCTVCHTVHKAPKAKMHCNWCHQIEVKVK